MELYVHLPFCRQKCLYCDFISFSGMESRISDYISALVLEAQLRRNEVTEPIKTVYIGGGTPSILSPTHIGRLLKQLRETLPLSTVSEWTVEANPGTVTESWLQTALNQGVNRLSLGFQAAQDSLLSLMGRIYQASAVPESVYLARKAGFQNISLDLIFGFPTQTVDDWIETLSMAVSLHPEHISAYGLIPEEGTPLMENLRSGKLALPEPEAEREMYEILLETMMREHYHQYEISNFAKTGRACLHNIGYWRQVPYLGLGLSAASLTNLCRHPSGGISYRRRSNTSDFETYLKQPIQGETEMVSPEEARFETLMLGLRMTEGVRESTFEALHGISLEATYGTRLRKQQNLGLLDHQNGSWFLTRRGMDLQNAVLVDLMD